MSRFFGYAEKTRHSTAERFWGIVLKYNSYSPNCTFGDKSTICSLPNELGDMVAWVGGMSRGVLDSTGLSAQCVSKLAFCLVQVYHTMRCYERTIWCSGKMQNRKHLLPELFHPFIFPGDTMEDIIVELRGDMSQQRVPLALISSASLRLCASAPLRLKVIRRTEHDRFSSLYLCISTPLGLCVEQRNQVGPAIADW
jgi:hypothetical protein